MTPLTTLLGGGLLIWVGAMVLFYDGGPGAFIFIVPGGLMVLTSVIAYGVAMGLRHQPMAISAAEPATDAAEVESSDVA